jgi:hypothetical protein
VVRSRLSGGGWLNRGIVIPQLFSGLSLVKKALPVFVVERRVREKEAKN